MDPIVDPGELERIFEKKEERRKRLAALPFPEKIAILVKLQERAAPILRARGREYKVWRIEEDNQAAPSNRGETTGSPESSMESE